MFDRFTDRARKAMSMARQEAQRFNHEYIGTEHILLGLVAEGSGVAAQVLKNLGVDLQTIRYSVENIVQEGPSMVTIGQLPCTPRVQKILEFAVEEASNLGHNYIGTEHLLLGLIREENGVGAQVLRDLGLTLNEVRGEIMRILKKPSSEQYCAWMSALEAWKEGEIDDAIFVQRINFLLDKGKE